MGDLKIKKVCGFNISSIHFSMMILPYINKELEQERNIITILEGNLERNIRQVLSKITINNEAKEKILNINWKASDIKKDNIEKVIKSSLLKKENLDIIVCGCEKYINLANEIIKKAINKNIKNIEEKNIKIIDCYTVNDFKENIREILDNHDIMFNTSGEHSIEEIFDGYHSA
ncbi:MAG: hypothetical protein ACI4VP_06560 [Clostridia bacterium]